MEVRRSKRSEGDASSSIDDESSIMRFGATPRENRDVKKVSLDFSKVDRTRLTVASLCDARDDRDYWRTRSPAERLHALEFLRQVHYGYDPATERLQRVLEVAELRAG